MLICVQLCLWTYVQSCHVNYFIATLELWVGLIFTWLQEDFAISQGTIEKKNQHETFEFKVNVNIKIKPTFLFNLSTVCVMNEINWRLGRGISSVTLTNLDVNESMIASVVAVYQRNILRHFFTTHDNSTNNRVNIIFVFHFSFFGIDNWVKSSDDVCRK